MSGSGLRVLAIITARGGSKGIPRKNVKLLAGKPLLTYMLQAAKGSKLLTRCIVSTEDGEIAEIAKKAGGDVPFLRPTELAQDDTRDIPVLQHAVQWLRENAGEEYDAVMMLHPTAPFTTAADIDACIDLLAKTGADSVMSMVEVMDFAPQKLKVLKDGWPASRPVPHSLGGGGSSPEVSGGWIEPLLEPEGKETAPRHIGEKVYKRNAAIYLTKTPLILAGDLFGKKSMAYVMPRERSIDINTQLDFDFAEFLLKKR